MVEYVQTLLLTIPVSAQVNSWEEIVNTVSIHICVYFCCCLHSLHLLWNLGQNQYNLLLEFIIYGTFHICCC